MENTLYKHIRCLQEVWFINVLACTLLLPLILATSTKGTSIANTIWISSENVENVVFSSQTIFKETIMLLSRAWPVSLKAAYGPYLLSGYNETLSIIHVSFTAFCGSSESNKTHVTGEAMLGGKNSMLFRSLTIANTSNQIKDGKNCVACSLFSLKKYLI